MLDLGESKQTEEVPLSQDEHGSVRIAGTRITLDTFMELFDQGATPEQISHSLSGLALDDVYAVITYCLRHESEVRDYLAAREKRAETLRENLEAEFPDNGFRERLLKLKRNNTSSS